MRTSPTGLFVLIALTLSGFASGQSAIGQNIQNEPFVLRLDAPIQTWDEAVPLGNGLTGGLLWGEGNTINLSLDRGDLWDERLPELYLEDDWNYATMKRLVAQRNQPEMVRRFDTPYNQIPYPTKLPGGRLVLTLDASQPASQFSLDMKTATGHVELASGSLEVFFSAVEPVAMMRVVGPASSYRFLRPKGLDRLEYPAAEFGDQGDTTWMVQRTVEGLRYAVVLASKSQGNETQLAVAIVSTNDGDDPLAIGQRRVAKALAVGFDAMHKPHAKWWHDFWSTSDVRVPHAAIQHHYNLVKYFYGAASRPDAPPMPLQGVWTRDDGGLPPWKGDFHHDLNTQMTYLAYPTAGLFHAGESFINYNWNLLPQYRKFAREFYDVEGAVVPGVATLSGKPTAGWSQYALSPTNGLWVGQAFDLHWQYTRDRRFLEQRAYPWLSEVANAVVDLLQQRDGKLYLPLSSSPEIHNNSMRAWLTPNSNHDLALIDWTFKTLADMAERLDLADDVRRWRKLRGSLQSRIVDDAKVLCFAQGEPMNQSHRHHAPTMAIHPLGTLHIEGSAEDRAVIDATLDRMHELGTQAWCGYSFSWFACIAARAARPEMALDYLIDYQRAFILRNGFHANGDQIGAGLSSARYRPFTLEGNFLAMEAVHEMLLQSWGGTVRIFPAVSEQWVDVAFDDLRAQGGFKVSAVRQDGQTARVRIEATVDGVLRLRDPFSGHTPKWNREDVPRDGDRYVIALKQGDVLEGSLTEDEQQALGKPWPMHVIDNSSRGADGVRLADVNRDGLMDITTGWEEGGVTRVYLHPGNDAAIEPWPAVTVGRTPSVEDAVFVDLDADGHTDVVSCCEGGTRTMFVHWAPSDPQKYLDPEAWTTEPLAASKGTMMWMFCLPMQIDGQGGIDLVAGAKGGGAKIGWFEAPENPRQLDQWKWHPIGNAGWIMSLRADDVDSDGDLDVVATDRRGELRGCRWLENPGPGVDQKRPWTNHFVGGRDREVMFMAMGDLDMDGTDDMLVAAKPEHQILFRRRPGSPPSWKPTTLQLPKNGGGSKGVAIGRIDGDKQPDIVFSCEGASGTKSGVMWLSYDKSPTEETWTAHALSGPAGIKFDRLELLDIDGDGDLDVLCCEESEPVDGKRRGLGVFWYENPIVR